MNPTGNAATSSTPDRGGSFHFPRLLAWVVLVISLGASAGGWYVSQENADLSAHRQFDEETNRIISALRQRLLIYQDVLHGCAGLFAASVSVERAEWRAYLESVSVDKRFPGIAGVGFIAHVPRGGLDEFLRATREDHAPDFTVQDDGGGDALMIVKYLEPEEPHRALLGRDIAGDAERRLVAEKARDAGSVVMSGRLKLAGTAPGTNYGFLLMLPVFHNGATTATVEQRRQNIEGWVFARVAGDQLMRGVLENQSSLLDIEIYDGTTPDPANHLFGAETGTTSEPPGFQPRFKDETVLGLAGRNWTVRFSSKPTFEAATPRSFGTMIGAGGAVVSLLLFGIAWSLTSTRQRALAMAWDMTAALRQTNEQLQRVIAERQRAEQATKDSQALYHALVESLPLHIVRKDLQGRITFANQRFCNEIGRSLKEISGKTNADLFSAELARDHERNDSRVIETGDTLEAVEEIQDAAGQKKKVKAIKVAARDGEGNVTGLLAILWELP
ncbi:MAG: PAS domain S-box protein [Verrucomicrobia bacterium]|nr:MAG: PAS domain S-box protein [Verrucomicrobiota bacterium]